MPIQQGERLKSSQEFEQEIITELSNRLGSGFIWPLPAPLHSVIRITARAMYEFQMDCHLYMGQTLPTGSPLVPQDPVDMSNPEEYSDFERMYGPGKFRSCCEPEDMKWYDSGISRFQYCVKCNREVK